jgi:ATP-dependent DNA ligase
MAFSSASGVRYLQKLHASYGTPLRFFIFDLMVVVRKDVTDMLLITLRQPLEQHVLSTLADPIRYSSLMKRKGEKD